jgi:hypothetical protein
VTKGNRFETRLATVQHRRLVVASCARHLHVDADTPQPPSTVAGLSMRALAKALDVDPMAIYHHVPNKATLLADVREGVINGLERQLPTRTAPQDNSRSE